MRSSLGDLFPIQSPDKIPESGDPDEEFIPKVGP